MKTFTPEQIGDFVTTSRLMLDQFDEDDIRARLWESLDIIDRLRFSSTTVEAVSHHLRFRAQDTSAGWLAIGRIPKKQEVITNAAIRTPEGLCWYMPIPARHHDLIKELSNWGYGPQDLADQGFRTNERQFVNRVDGLKIATEAGQIKEKTGNDNELFSEDLW